MQQAQNDENPTPEKQEFLVLPYVAVGGLPEGWHFMTVVSLENRKNSQILGGFEFFSNEGAPLHVQINDGAEEASETEWTLEPKGEKITVLSHPGNSFEAGWLRVNVARQADVSVMVVVQFYNGHNLIGQAGAMAGSGQRPVSYKLISADTPDATSLLKNPSRVQMVNLENFANAAGVSQSKINGAEMGLASWYGYPYHGRKAADGSIYDKHKLTAAHRTLPFGTRARVTNLRNHRSVTVRITDRGPFIDKRVVDLSERAAVQIGMFREGIAPVLVQLLPS
ncbi:MAG: septal ring lytic transglycosylase RlpA family protein [Acidobacteria bacterium]|nr:septal ring lytic transglycosylase RlpA family protein [Acidobacteriota bacterium]